MTTPLLINADLLAQEQYGRVDGSSDLSSSDAHAILESPEPAPPYDLGPAICMRVGDVIARAATLSSRPAWVVAVMEKSWLTERPRKHGAL